MSSRRRPRLACAGLAILAASLAVPAGAQNAPAPPPPATAEPTADTKAANKVAQDQAREIVTEVLNTAAPAFAALGVSGQTITEPEGLKRAAIGFLNGTDEDGKAVTGIAVQFAPAQLIKAQQVSYERYRTDYWARAWARFQITAAYARATDGDASQPERAALGGIWVPFDTTDPFANKKLHACLMQAFAARRVRNETATFSPPRGIGTETTETDTILATDLESCRKRHVRTPTNGHSAQLGFAKVFRSRDNGGLAGRGFAASAVVSIGLDCLFTKPCSNSIDPIDPERSRIGGKLVLGGVIRERELVANPLDATQLIERNRRSFGARLLVGDPSRWWLGFELLRQRASYSGLGKDDYTTYNASFDFKLAKGMWLTANYANSSGDNFGKSAQFTGGLKFALQPASFAGN
jgi:hypothetical protein